MMKKICTALCAAVLMGSVACAADATIADGQQYVYTHDDGSTLTIQYSIQLLPSLAMRPQRRLLPSIS